MCFVVCLASFTQYNVFEIHPPSWMYQQWNLFSFHCVNGKQLVVCISGLLKINLVEMFLQKFVGFFVDTFLLLLDTYLGVCGCLRNVKLFSKMVSQFYTLTSNLWDLHLLYSIANVGFVYILGNLACLIFQKLHPDITWGEFMGVFLLSGVTVLCHSVHTNSSILLSFILIY